MKYTVLILVLVEDGLGDPKGSSINLAKRRLNPCFSGGWSRRILLYLTVFLCIVLILVLVEDGLGVHYKDLKYAIEKVLILVLVEDGLGALNADLIRAFLLPS